MSLIVATLRDGVTIVLEGLESPTLRRVLAACQLLGVDAQCVVHDADADADAALRDRFRSDAWVLVGDQPLVPRIRALRAAGFTAWLCVVGNASGASESEASLLDAGADCYTSVPFDLDTLAARLRSLLRHTSGTFAAYRGARAELRDSQRLLVVGENSYVLSPRELALLRYLSDRAGCWVRRDKLLRDLFGAQRGYDSSIVRTTC